VKFRARRKSTGLSVGQAEEKDLWQRRDGLERPTLDRRHSPVRWQRSVAAFGGKRFQQRWAQQKGHGLRGDVPWFLGFERALLAGGHCTTGETAAVAAATDGQFKL
jgi:hypothetical protein